jgi:hypothetical protein
MLTLIETNEQLSIAMSKHQRAILQARKAIGATPSPQPQAQPGQRAYPQQPPQPQNGQSMYVTQPPQAQPGQRMYPSPASLPHRAEQEVHVAPPGPPPGAMGAIRTNEYAVRAKNNAYSFPPPIPTRSRPMSQEPAAPTRTLDYGVSENPFADTSPERQQPQQKSYSLFDGPSQTTPPPLQGSTHSEQRQATYIQQDPAQKSYEPYNPGYHSTPSYVNRQDSATNNLTMYGASPPPEEGQTDRMGQSPASLVDQTRDVQRRMGNMRA